MESCGRKNAKLRNGVHSAGERKGTDGLAPTAGTGVSAVGRFAEVVNGREPDGLGGANNMMCSEPSDVFATHAATGHFLRGKMRAGMVNMQLGQAGGRSPAAWMDPTRPTGPVGGP